MSPKQSSNSVLLESENVYFALTCPCSFIIFGYLYFVLLNEVEEENIRNNRTQKQKLVFLNTKLKTTYI